MKALLSQRSGRGSLGEAIPPGLPQCRAGQVCRTSTPGHHPCAAVLSLRVGCTAVLDPAGLVSVARRLGRSAGCGGTEEVVMKLVRVALIALLALALWGPPSVAVAR